MILHPSIKFNHQINFFKSFVCEITNHLNYKILASAFLEKTLTIEANEIDIRSKGANW